MRTYLQATIQVLWKELREALREPTVLLFSVGFPILFYPLLIWATIQLVTLEEGLFEQSPPEVAVEGSSRVVEAATEAGLTVVSGTPEDVAAGSLDLHIQATERGEALELLQSYSSTRTSSRRALERFDRETDQLEDDLAEAMAAKRAVDLDSLEPRPLEREDLSPPAEVTAFLLSRAVPAIMLVSLILGAAYPAVEVVVGERERKTIETTMVAAVPRETVLLGKVLAVLSIVALSTVGNVGSVLLTLLHVEATLGGGDSGASIAFDWVALALATPAIAVTAALAVALMILAALPATTFKQGQNLVSLISTLGMGGAVVGMLPTVELDLTMAAVPMANAVLVLRDALAGDLALVPTLVATAVNGVLAAIILALAARVAGRETYLFGASLPRWLAPLRRSKAS